MFKLYLKSRGIYGPTYLSLWTPMLGPVILVSFFLKEAVPSLVLSKRTRSRNPFLLERVPSQHCLVLLLFILPWGASSHLFFVRFTVIVKINTCRYYCTLVCHSLIIFLYTPFSRLASVVTDDYGFVRSSVTATTII